VRRRRQRPRSRFGLVGEKAVRMVSAHRSLQNVGAGQRKGRPRWRFGLVECCLSPRERMSGRAFRGAKGDDGRTRGHATKARRHYFRAVRRGRQSQLRAVAW
jgi:hypothetical protein